MLLETTSVSVDDFERETGWEIKPEGACMDDLCVPLPGEAREGDGRLDVHLVAEALGMPLLEDTAHGLVALGPPTVVGRALQSAAAPELELPDVDGNPFRLSTLYGKKVLLVAWASW